MCQTALVSAQVPTDESVTKKYEWQLARDKNDIQIYTRKVDGAKLKEYKATMEIHSTSDDVLHAITEVKDYTQWMHQMAEARILRSSANELELYCLQSAPWPAKDRDIYSVLTIHHLSAGIIRVDMRASQDESPIQKGRVRVPEIDGYWLIEPLVDGRVRVTQQLLAHPGGSLPEWLANAVVTDNPYHSFTNLREWLKV